MSVENRRCTCGHGPRDHRTAAFMGSWCAGALPNYHVCSCKSYSPVPLTPSEHVAGAALAVVEWHDLGQAHGDQAEGRMLDLLGVDETDEQHEQRLIEDLREALKLAGYTLPEYL